MGGGELTHKKISFKIDGTEFEAYDGMTLSEWCDSEFNTTDDGFGNKQYTIGGTVDIYTDTTNLFDATQYKVSNDDYTSSTELSDGDEIKMYNVYTFDISNNYGNLSRFTYLDGMSFKDYCNNTIDSSKYTGEFVIGSWLYLTIDRFNNDCIIYNNCVIKDITPNTKINNGTTYYTYGMEMMFYVDSTGYNAYEGLTWAEFIDLCQASGVNSELTYDSGYVYQNNVIINENGSSVNNPSVNPYNTISSYTTYYLRNENE